MAIFAITLGLAAVQTGVGVAGAVQNKKARKEAKNLANIQMEDDKALFNRQVANEERSLDLQDRKLGFEKEQANLTQSQQEEDMQKGQDDYARDTINASLDKTTKSMVRDKEKKVGKLGMMKTQSSMLGGL